MRVRIDDVFAMKFDDEIERLNELSGKSVLVCSECYEPWYEDSMRCAADKECEGKAMMSYERSPVPRKLAIEEFLEAMGPALARVLKLQFLDTLLADAAATQAVENVNKNSSSMPIPLDSATTI
jgi:hypothetical protein